MRKDVTMSGPSLSFHCYLEPQPVTTQWWLNVAHALWRRGLHFAASPPPTLTWEAELAATDHLIVAPDGHQIAGTLREGLEHLAALGGTGLAVWDNGVELGLDLYPSDFPATNNAQLPSPALMRLMLSTARARTLPPALRPANWLDPYAVDLAPTTVVPGFLQRRLALLHWSGVLCELLRPVYGVGYDVEHDVRDSLAELREGIQRALHEGRMPDIGAHLTDGYVQYLAPSYATAERLLSYLGTPGWTVRRLATGGAFVLSAGEPFHYARGAENREVLLGERTRASVRQAVGSSDAVQGEAVLEPLRDDIRRHFHRALEIAQASGDADGVKAMRAYLPKEDFVEQPGEAGGR
jgi:hypothetical protein